MYIAVPHDVGSNLILEAQLVGKHLSRIKRQLSDKQELEGALQAIVNRFKDCKIPIVIPTSLVARYGLTNQVTKFLAATNIAWRR
jgi:TPP-dependent 2-oxoacid decarboxylase